MGNNNSAPDPEPASANALRHRPEDIVQENDSVWTLYKPETGKQEVDIVCFHGLQLSKNYEDAFWRTWLSRDGTLVWPKDWLSKSFPKARILSVSYDSSAQNSYPTDPYSIAENLIEDLICGAQAGQTCPVILVGHCLGGFMIKSVFITCRALRGTLKNKPNQQEKLNSIERFLGNCTGVFYYATPHAGSRLADYANKIKGMNKPLMELLQTLSTKTSQINQEFANTRRYEGEKDIRTYAVAESLDTTYLGMNWRVVEEASARQDIEDLYTAEKANHFDVCKPVTTKDGIFAELEKFITAGIANRGKTITTGPEAGGAKEVLASQEELRAKRLGKFDTKSNNYVYSSVGGQQTEVVYQKKKKDEQFFFDFRTPPLPTASTADESHVPGAIEPLPPNSDAIGEGQVVGEQEVLENDSGLIAEAKMRASRTSFVKKKKKKRRKKEEGTSFVEVFERELREGREDAYFVSSKWLVSLEEQEKDSLMSILCRGGYSETCQTGGTILFARTENQSSRSSGEEFVSLENVDAQKACDDLEIARKGPNTDKSAAIADVFGSSSNLVEPSSSIDHERTLRKTFSTERRQAVEWESFKVALKSSSNYQSFCVSSRWLSNLEDQEKEALTTHVREAGYEKISQNSNGTWYQRVRGGEESSGADDNHPSSSSEGNVVAGGKVQESTISKLLGYLTLKPKMDGANNPSGSSHVASTTDTNEIQDADFNCHAQTLRVACSSSTHQTPGEPLQNGDFYRQEFGDSVGHWPIRESDNISTKLEKSFKIPTIQFFTDERGTEVSREVLINLKAFAETSLSCCLRVGHHPQKHPPKIRLKFSKISAQVHNKDSEEKPCTPIILRYLCTSVYCSEYRSGPDSFGKQIPLQLEDEYNSPPGKRLLADSQLSRLEKSGITPYECEPGSTSLVLRSDSGIAHPLLFQDTRPAVFEGHTTSGTYLESFLKFHIRHRLEISYFKPSSPIREEGAVWIANNTTREIDFGCCLAIRT